MTAKSTYNRRDIFNRAWALARRMETANGGAARFHFADALRTVWSTVKREAIEARFPKASERDIARSLRSAAARAEMVGRTAATDKQISYLASLLRRAGQDDRAVTGGNSSFIFTKFAASQMISAYTA